MRPTILSAILGTTLLTSGAAIAGHANPWATLEDELLMQNHEENLEQSENTPGEDEMLGVMDRRAYGKLGGSPSADGDTAGSAGGGNPGVGGGR